MTNEVLQAFMAYDWPGNVRELQNCLDRMTAVNSGPLLYTADLPSSVQTSIEASRVGMSTMAAVAVAARITHNGSSVIPLEEVERTAILNALEKTKGDRAAAAHFLGIGRTTLYRKLKGYGITADLLESASLEA